MEGRRPLVMTLVVAALAVPVKHVGAAGEAAALGWCATDTAIPSCTTEYALVAPACLGDGFRACLIEKARHAARSDDCGGALKLARACQCHATAVRDALEEAAVCEWLRSN